MRGGARLHTKKRKREGRFAGSRLLPSPSRRFKVVRDIILGRVIASVRAMLYWLKKLQK